MLKKIVLIFLFILTLLAALLVYVNNVFLPVKFKHMIIREASKKLNRVVTIEDLYYLPLKGLVLENVVVYEKAPQKEKFFSAKEIAVSIFYAPLIFQKKIIIPSLVVDKPVLTISYERTQQWNFEDLFTPLERKPKEPELSVYVAGLAINNATMVFFDKNMAKDAIEQVENINIQASLALPQNMKATIKIFPRKPGAMKIFADLNYDFITRDFLCQLRAENAFLDHFLAYVNHPEYALEKIKINVASLDLAQRNGKISGSGEFFFDTAHVHLQEKNLLSFMPTLRLSEIHFQKNQWHLKGQADIKKIQGNLDNSLSINGDLVYDFLATQAQEKITVEGQASLTNLIGKFGPQINFTSAPQGKLNFSFSKNTLSLETQLTLNNLQAALKPNAQFVDNPLFKLSLTYDPAVKDKPLRYACTLAFQNGKITNLPIIETAEAISGKISFEPDKFSADAFSAVISQAPLAFSGIVENFKDPILNIDVSATNFNLTAWKIILAPYLPENAITVEGIATFQLKYKGKLKKLAGSSVDCTLTLKDGLLKSPATQDAPVGISGDITYAVAKLNLSHYLPDEGSWKNVSIAFQGKDYLLNGTLKFNNLKTTVARDDLSILLDSTLLPDRVKIVKLDAQYKNAHASSQGEVFYPKGKEGPKLNVKFDANFSLEDLADLAPSLKEKLSSISPRGPCAVTGLLIGTLTQWRDWSLALNIESDRAYFYGYQFDQLLIKYEQRDRFINNFSLSAAVYDGLLDLQGSSDLSIAEMPYKTKLDIKNVNFAKLKNDTPLKDKDISGMFNATYTGNGPLSNPLLSQGQGFLSVKNGKLWQFDVLKGLAQLLFVPGKENITLDSAESNFSIVNQKILIKDALIKGNQMELSCNGAVNFSGEVDIDIVSRFAEGVIRSSESLQKTIAAFFTQAEDFLTVKITGTLQKPQYKIIPKPLNVIQKTKDFILDVLPNIFQ